MLEQHSFGNWLKLKRKALDLTRENLANRVGCSAATIRKIEAEERRPSAQIVERLAEILNIPSNERKDFLQFARGDLASAPHETVEETPWRTSSKSARSNLPATVTSLVGREKEIADVRNYLLQADVRLVTLIGPPGIGKTRLSLEAARASLSDFPDGVFFVALALLDDPSLILRAVVQALGYVEAANLPVEKQLADGIGDKQMLIVLDNCEHLIDSIAPLVSDLLLACSRLKIIATSRESMRVRGEWLYSVPVLEIPRESSSVDMETAWKFPALTLFAERARAVRPDFVLNTGNIQTISTICTQLDGLPLAIELIASRIRWMSPESLLARLTDQFILSADGMRAVSARQKTLNNAIGWSYNLLSPEEQNLFAQLAVFSGGFTLEAAESIFSGIGPEKSVYDLITSLSDKNLLQRSIDSQGELRFNMLVTIQLFVLNQLRNMGNEPNARNRHLEYFLAFAEKGDNEMRRKNQVVWLNRLNGMRDNLRAALEWAIETKQADSALRMVRKLHWFWFVRSDHMEGRQWLERVLALPDVSLHPQLHAEALTQLVHHIFSLRHRVGLQTEAHKARRLAEQAIAIARTNNDKLNIAKALDMLGLIMTDEKDFSSVQSALEESQALFREIRDEWWYAHAILALGFAAYSQVQLSTSLALNKQALAGFREVGDRFFMSVCLRYIGDIYMQQGDPAQGMAALRESLILVQQLGSKYEIAAVLSDLAVAAQRAGEPVRAFRLFWAARNVWDSIGGWQASDEIDFENNLALCHAALDELGFATAVEQGRAMSMEEAITYALETDAE